MATQITKEQTNYMRTMNLVMQKGKEAVKIKFDSEFHPVLLQSQLRRKRSKLEDLKKKRVINSEQWNYLFPHSGRCQFLH